MIALVSTSSPAPSAGHRRGGVQRRRAGGERDGVGRVAGGGEGLLERVDRRALRQPVAAQHLERRPGRRARRPPGDRRGSARRGMLVAADAADVPRTLAPRPPWTSTGKTLLITGATGSFGRAFMRTVLDRYDVEAIRVFSRDELKQSELDATFHDDRAAAPPRRRARPRPPAASPRAASTSSSTPPRSSRCRRASTTRSRRCRPTSSAPRTSSPRRSTTDVPLTIALSTDKAVNPVEPLRRDQAVRGEDLRPGRRLRRRHPGALRVRALRQRRRQPRQRHPDLQAAGADRRGDDHRRADDALLDHARRRRSSSCSARCRSCAAARRSCRRSRACASSTWPRRSRRASSAASSASGPARSCTRCCSPRTRRATPSTSATAT